MNDIPCRVTADLRKYEAEQDRAITQEEFINQMTMADIWYFFGDISGAAQSALIKAIRDQDEHEVGAIFMQALREYAEVNTE